MEQPLTRIWSNSNSDSDSEFRFCFRKWEMTSGNRIWSPNSGFDSGRTGSSDDPYPVHPGYTALARLSQYTPNGGDLFLKTFTLLVRPSEITDKRRVSYLAGMKGHRLRTWTLTASVICIVRFCWQCHSRNQHRLTAISTQSVSADSAIHTISVCWLHHPHDQLLQSVQFEQSVQ